MTLTDYPALMLDCEKMKQLREALGLNQSEAARQAELAAGRSQWNDIESGRRSNITLETLGKIAAALGVNPSELLLAAPGAKPPAKRKAK